VPDHVSQERRGRVAARALVALAVSAAANAAALRGIEALGAFRAPAAHGTTAVALSPVSAALWQANRTLEPGGPDRPPAPAPAASPRAARPAPQEPDPSGTVVRVQPSPDGRRPAHARFLADRDNTVAHDVQSREAGKRRWDTTLSRPTPGSPGPQGIPLPGDGGTADASRPGAEGAPRDAPRPSGEAGRAGAGVQRGAAEPRDPESDVARARAAFAPSADPRRAAGLDPRVAVARGGEGEGGARRSGRYDPRLLPTATTFERLSGGPGERLPDVDQGDATLLSTRRFKYADFHLRVKESIVREWDPNRLFDARDPDGRRFGRARKTATVDIVLEPDGALREVRLVHGSGLEFYDRELVRAIHAAAPFPNPPRALVRAGAIVLRGWRFDLVHDDGFVPRLGLAGARGP
jgi:TonB family protein